MVGPLNKEVFCDCVIPSYGFDMIIYSFPNFTVSLQWRHNWCDGVSNHQPHHCLLNRLFRRRSKKTSNPRVTGPCVGISPVTGEFPAQMASNAENVSIWWCHHVFTYSLLVKEACAIKLPAEYNVSFVRQQFISSCCVFLFTLLCHPFRLHKRYFGEWSQAQTSHYRGHTETIASITLHSIYSIEYINRYFLPWGSSFRLTGFNWDHDMDK